MTANESGFDKWLDECRAILIESLLARLISPTRWISGAGIDIYTNFPVDYRLSAASN